MDPRTVKTFSEHLLLGGALAATGVTAGLWLPLVAALFLFGVTICRIGWIEDTIREDLLTAERLPPDYRPSRWSRLWPATGEDLKGASPMRLASSLRLQAHAAGAFGWGVAAGVLLPAGAALPFAGGVVALALALRHADYLALGAAHLATGTALPRRLIAGRAGSTPVQR